MIYSKWMRSLRYGNDFFKLIESQAYYDAYQLYITALLAKENSLIRMAVITEDHDVVLGFAVSRGSVLDYVHVHGHNRYIGIGKKLIPKDIDTITHITRTGLIIWGNKYPHWKFNPFA